LAVRYFAIVLAAASAGALAQTGGDVPRATYIQVQDTEFRKMDADKDGQVTRAEAEGFQRADAVARAGQRARAVFSQLDADRNGQLSFTEFARTQSGSPQVNAQPFIAQLDLNKDGRVSLVEHRAGKLRYFDNIDTDKDGVVTAAEMKAAGVLK
jgi:Ca2+-binding EF-hand superfamily protein